MPKSKTDKSRKAKQDQFKESQSKGSKVNPNQPGLLQDPNIRQFPVWRNNDKITIYGAEWEEIFNFVNGVQGAYAACSSVMNRGILDGNIRMRFEKRNEDGLFVPMTPEEEVPYQQEFSKIVAQAKQIAEQAVKQSMQPEPPSQEGIPNLNDIVDSNGNPYSKMEGSEEAKPENSTMSIVRD